VKARYMLNQIYMLYKSLILNIILLLFKNDVYIIESHTLFIRDTHYKIKIHDKNTFNCTTNFIFIIFFPEIHDYLHRYISTNFQDTSNKKTNLTNIFLSHFVSNFYWSKIVFHRVSNLHACVYNRFLVGLKYHLLDHCRLYYLSKVFHQ